MTTPDNVTQKATMPSREFLVRQAVLNAGAQIYPMSAANGTLPMMFRFQKYHAWRHFEDSQLYFETLVQFRKLVSRFRAAEYNNAGPACLPGAGLK